MRSIITGIFEGMLGFASLLLVLVGGMVGAPFGLGWIVAGAIAGFVVAAILFGALYTLLEIRDLLRVQAANQRLTAPATASAATPVVTQGATPMPTIQRSAGICQRCGYGNSPGQTTCSNCGSPL